MDMRSGTKKALNWVPAVAVLALVVSACGNDDDGDAAAPDPDGDHSGELTVWIMGDAADPVGSAVGEMAAAFEAEHEDVSINVEYVPWTAGKDHYTNAIIAGEVPDLAESGNTWTPEFAEEGVLAEVDLSRDEFVPVLEESATFDGATYGYPWYGGSRVLLYRTDLFDEAGVEPPDTWDDVLEIGETIEAETGVAAFQVAANNQHFFLPLVWQAGGEIATQEGDTWTPGFDTAEGHAAFEYFDTLWQTGWSPPDAQTDDFTSLSLAEEFTNGQSAMVTALPWQVTGIIADNPDLEGNIGAVLMPAGPAGNRDTLAGGSHLVVFEESQQKDLAAAFAEYMIASEQATDFAETTGFFPGTVAEAEAIVDEDDWLSPVAAEQFIEHARAYPVAGWWGALEGATAVKDTLQELIAGNFTVEEAAANLDNEINSRTGNGSN
ncbi:extracellular solute-binding protein [Phytoactinopolyspora mesophila]|uniref:Extracellular solute-binding protein n=1 Tax=Phytoactinopolyspora mesophila TaxID=2650750 RepID=A0A7K3M6J8_9ACTN|nr:extracellular solute-binding protein [Phytoactinopolyspora mesophila]NDL58667.1 extracellular solute-binding protein [Phytoactinopolyspora mesophila]